MANREALRELQARLANRLQAASTEEVATSWLAVKAGGGNYLFPLAQSGEIFASASIQALPYSRPWFCGVVNLRGGLYGVVDLAAFIADAAAAPRSEQALAESSMITLNAALEVNCALMVDGLAGLRHGKAFQDPAPPATGSPSYFGDRYTDSSGDHWQEINLRSLSQLPQFLSISA